FLPLVRLECPSRLSSLPDAVTIEIYTLSLHDALPIYQYLTFVVVGGGPTGVELAGAIAEIAKFAVARDFVNINPELAQIYIIERSEEHTSELQSRENLVCRLLLEKKKKKEMSEKDLCQ